MNQKLALGLSVVGVLAAGSAAALVNTQILSAGAEATQQAAIPAPTDAGPIVLTIDPVTGAVSTPTSMPAPVEANVSSTPAPPQPQPVVTAAPPPAGRDESVTLQVLADPTESAQTPEPTTTTAPSTTTVPAPTTTLPAATTVDYRVGSAGSVTLDTAGDLLRVVSVQHEAGWTVAQALQVSPTGVQITFRSATIEVVFRANLAFGVVTPSVTSSSLATVPPAPGGSYGGSGYDDDDDDYEYDDDHDEYEGDDDHDEYEDDDDHDDDHDGDRDDD